MPCGGENVREDAGEGGTRTGVLWWPQARPTWTSTQAKKTEDAGRRVLTAPRLMSLGRVGSCSHSSGKLLETRSIPETRLS